MQIHWNVSKKENDELNVEAIIIEATLEEIEVFNEFEVSYHFREFKEALAKASRKIKTGEKTLVPTE